MSRQKIVITGASSGIGFELAQHYLKLGHTVIGCSRNASSLEALNYFHFLVDVTNEKNVIDFSANLKKKFDTIDSLITCAGIGRISPVLLTPGETASEIISTNFLGTFLICREIARLMTFSGGQIITISSTARPLNLEGSAIYAASKAAVETFTRILAKELSSFKITVNCVGPNLMPVGHVKFLSKKKLENALAKHANSEIGNMNDLIKKISLYLFSENRALTGQIVYLGSAE